MKKEIQDKLKDIKSRFRLSMNGVTSQSMREKGLGYKINWGVNLLVLKGIAAEYGKDYDLAVELWKEDIRECKILATMIMPYDKMSEDLVELWIDQMPNQEMAEMTSFNLFQHIKGIKDCALMWLASESSIRQICGYHVLSRLLSKGEAFSEREINELIDQGITALYDADMAVKHAAMNMLSHFGDISETHYKILKSALKSHDLDIF